MIRWAVAPWDPKSIYPEKWAEDKEPIRDRGEFHVINTSSRELAFEVCELLNAEAARIEDELDE